MREHRRGVCAMAVSSPLTLTTPSLLPGLDRSSALTTATSNAAFHHQQHRQQQLHPGIIGKPGDNNRIFAFATSATTSPPPPPPPPQTTLRSPLSPSSSSSGFSSASSSSVVGSVGSLTSVITSPGSGSEDNRRRRDGSGGSHSDDSPDDEVMTETAISEEAAPQFDGDEINGGTGGGSAEDVGKARPRTTSPEDDPDDGAISSPDEIPRDPDWSEERFRVDRKKLEALLSSDPNVRCQQGLFGLPESGAAFFQAIMDATGTTITWPSKLKIGAKSKKDPHIKVTGKRDFVERAKEMVVSKLDTKSQRTTLKMDVSFTDHSHVIGKGGNNIKKVMEETGCHIHFPDSNRANSGGEKSNQVSIAGHVEGVEAARKAIRRLLPLVLAFDFQIGVASRGIVVPSIDANHPLIQRVQQLYNITVMIKPKTTSIPPTTTFFIRGTVDNEANVIQATRGLIDCLSASFGAGIALVRPSIVSTQMEISPQHHTFIQGKNELLIKQITQRTGVHIIFPDGTSSSPSSAIAPLMGGAGGAGGGGAADMQLVSAWQTAMLHASLPSPGASSNSSSSNSFSRKSSVTICGTKVENVVLARSMLIGCLPLVLMFDMKDDTNSVDAAQIAQYMETLDVFISVKPKPKQPSKSVIVKSMESNYANVYEARRLLLIAGNSAARKNMNNFASPKTNTDSNLELSCSNLFATSHQTDRERLALMEQHLKQQQQLAAALQMAHQQQQQQHAPRSIAPVVTLPQSTQSQPYLHLQQHQHQHQLMQQSAAAGIRHLSTLTVSVPPSHPPPITSSCHTPNSTLHSLPLPCLDSPTTMVSSLSPHGETLLQTPNNIAQQLHMQQQQQFNARPRSCSDASSVSPGLLLQYRGLQANTNDYSGNTNRNYEANRLTGSHATTFSHLPMASAPSPLALSDPSTKYQQQHHPYQNQSQHQQLQHQQPQHLQPQQPQPQHLQPQQPQPQQPQPQHLQPQHLQPQQIKQKHPVRHNQTLTIPPLMTPPPIRQQDDVQQPHVQIYNKPPPANDRSHQGNVSAANLASHNPPPPPLQSSKTQSSASAYATSSCQDSSRVGDLRKPSAMQENRPTTNASHCYEATNEAKSEVEVSQAKTPHDAVSTIKRVSDSQLRSGVGGNGNGFGGESGNDGGSGGNSGGSGGNSGGGSGVSRFVSPSNSGSSADLMALRAASCAASGSAMTESSGGLGGILGEKSLKAKLSGIVGEVADRDVDKRAPGCERRLHGNPTSSSSRGDGTTRGEEQFDEEEGIIDAGDEAEGADQDCFASDYEEQKLRATKAMAKRPTTAESRRPTDMWSGLGFSKSMPENAIRDAMNLRGRLIQTHHEPTLAEADEDAEETTSTVHFAPGTDNGQRNAGEMPTHDYRGYPSSGPKQERAQHSATQYPMEQPKHSPTTSEEKGVSNRLYDLSISNYIDPLSLPKSIWSSFGNPLPRNSRDESAETRKPSENDSRDSSSKASMQTRQSASGRPPLPPSNHRTDNSTHNSNSNYNNGRGGAANVSMINAPANVTQTQQQQQHQTPPPSNAQIPPQHQQQHRSSSNSSPECKLDLPDLFSSYGLGKYTDLFQQQEIDLTTFLTLTEEDLRNLGISTFGARRKMLIAIAELNARTSNHVLQAHQQQRTAAAASAEAALDANLVAAAADPTYVAAMLLQQQQQQQQHQQMIHSASHGSASSSFNGGSQSLNRGVPQHNNNNNGHAGHSANGANSVHASAGNLAVYSGNHGNGISGNNVGFPGFVNQGSQSTSNSSAQYPSQGTANTAQFPSGTANSSAQYPGSHGTANSAQYPSFLSSSAHRFSQKILGQGPCPKTMTSSSTSSPSNSFSGADLAPPPHVAASHQRSPSASFTEGATPHQQHPSTAAIIGAMLSASLNGAPSNSSSSSSSQSRLRRGGHLSPNSLRPPPGFNASNNNNSNNNDGNNMLSVGSEQGHGNVLNSPPTPTSSLFGVNPAFGSSSSAFCFNTAAPPPPHPDDDDGSDLPTTTVATTTSLGSVHSSAFSVPHPTSASADSVPPSPPLATSASTAGNSTFYSSSSASRPSHDISPPPLPPLNHHPNQGPLMPEHKFSTSYRNSVGRPFTGSFSGRW